MSTFMPWYSFHVCRHFLGGTILFAIFTDLAGILMKTGISRDIPSIYVACALFSNPQYTLVGTLLRSGKWLSPSIFLRSPLPGGSIHP
uniref:Uncharacterized protein n=1 Tax=Picea glauca TaxID=3330 RepID=A0A101LVN2_PICGL|nr:hypothetical protein ABT39_MTgene2106 [Picea glauca]